MSWLSKQMGWDKQDKKLHPVVPHIEGGGILNVPGAMVNAMYTGYHDFVNNPLGLNQEEESDSGTKPPDPNTFGDVTQGAPGAWIRAKQGTGTTRTSTFLTRGMSAGKIRARQTASGSTGY
jgi:hypothetical protein